MTFLESISEAFLEFTEWLFGIPSRHKDNHPGHISQEEWEKYYEILKRDNGKILHQEGNVLGTKIAVDIMVCVHKDRTVTVNGTNYPVAYVEESDTGVTVLYYERRYDATLPNPDILYRRARLSYIQYNKTTKNNTL